MTQRFIDDDFVVVRASASGSERTNFGIIHVRTEGERVLVFAHSGKAGLNEAYRFRVTLGPLGDRQVAFENLRTA